MKKYSLLIGIVLGLFLISSVSAMNFDNVKKIKETKGLAGYNNIEIENAFGLGDLLWEGTLNTNTERCSNDCQATQTIILHKKGSLIDDIMFKTLQDDGSWKEEPIESYEIYVNNKIYELGTELKVGTYEVKLKGSKGSKTVDWIYKTQGKVLDEWATWGGYLLFDGTVAYWTCDENSTGYLIDSLGHANATGSTSGITPDSIPGVVNNATFNRGISPWSVNNTVVPDSFNLSGNYTGWSINFWINFSKTRGEAALYSSTGGVGGTGTFQLGKTSKNYFIIEIGGHTNTSAWNVTLNETFMITLVSNDSNYSHKDFYVNGVLNYSLPHAGSPDFQNMMATASGPVSFGILGSAETVGMSGSIDELGIWNRSLTQTDITNLYNSGDGFSYNDSIDYKDGTSSVTLNSPVDNYDSNSVLSKITFNCSANVLGANLVNISLWHNVSGTFELNQTNSTINPESNTTTFNAKFARGTYAWNCQACDDDGDCGFATNRTINFNIDLNQSYNNVTYETDEETFYINVSDATDGILYYNGTSYTATNSGDLWSRTIDIPLTLTPTAINKSFFWSFNSGTQNTTTELNQSVLHTNFSLCGLEGRNTTFLNLTFQDEADNSLINASIQTSTFNYYLGSGKVNKTYSFINVTDNFEYDFCGVPNQTMNITPTIQYRQGTAYPQRIWEPGIQSYSNTTTNQTLFLLASADGIYVTFQVVNNAEQLLDDVDVTAERNGAIVGSGTTGAEGTVTFWLNPDFIHSFTFTKTGYTTYETSFFPTQTSYTITLSGGVAVSGYDYSKGINYKIYPESKELVNKTEYEFNYTISSSFWEITDFGFILKVSNGTILQSTSQTTNGGFLTLAQNTQNHTRIIMDYYYVVNNTYLNQTVYWNVFNTGNTQWSIKNFFDDFDAYLTVGFFGIDEFGKYLLIFFILFISVGVMSFKYGLTSPIAISSMVFAIIFFFDVVLDLLPEPINAIPNTLTFMSLIILIVLIFKEVQT